MSDRKSPTLDLLVLCSYVVFDGNQQPFSLNELLHTVTIEPNDEGQLAAPDLMLYAQMTDEDAQGRYRFRIEVRTASNVIIPGPQDRGVDVDFESRYHPVRPYEHVFVVRGLVFPAPGVYHFHVMCGHGSMCERPDAPRAVRLRVIRAEAAGGQP